MQIMKLARAADYWQKKSSGIMYTWKTAEGEDRRAPWGQSVRQAITRKAGWARVALEHRTGYRQWVRRWLYSGGRNRTSMEMIERNSTRKSSGMATGERAMVGNQGGMGRHRS